MDSNLWLLDWLASVLTTPPIQTRDIKNIQIQPIQKIMSPKTQILDIPGTSFS